MKKKNYFSIFKPIGWLCLLSVLMFSATSLFAQDTTTGLMLHYDFNSLTGVAPETVTDLSGNGMTGTTVGATTSAVGYGTTGLAAYFPTVASPASDYITLPAGLTSSLTDFTVAAWIKLDNLKTWARVFDFGTGESVYMFLSPSSGSYPRFAFKNGGSEQQISGSSAIPTGQWVHIAVTCSYVNGVGTGTLYVNGAVAGTNTDITITPAALGTTTQNYIGKSQWPDPGLNGSVDEFRVYNRALTNSDILVLGGYPSSFITDYSNLALAGNLSNITSSLTLPTTIGTSGTTITWKSSLPSAIDTLGNVTRPALYDATAKLTATLTQTVSGVTYTLTKIFNVTVKALNAASDQLAEWDFAGNTISESNNGVLTVKDEQSGFVGTVMNDARIRTIGTSTQYNVLDLGNGTGYFDMGTDIGKAIYSLNNFTMMGYFRIDDTYASLNSNGNFMWTFSNSSNSGTDQNGYIFGSLKNQGQSITPTYYSTEQYVGLSTNASKGAWHHIAYTQSGTTGTVYVDGVSVATGSVTDLPSITLPISGRTGTLYNWLGRSCYNGDQYLQNTLLYDFQLLGVALSSDDINLGFANVSGVNDMLGNLNNAYAENPDYILPELATEMDNLSLTGLSAVTSNISLPVKGVLDPSITISWKSSSPSLIDSIGNVTRPNYYNYNDTLTASLTKNGQKVTKSFPATVIAKDGTPYTSNLLVKYDFSSVADSVVTDAAEKHLTGVLKNNAKVRTIGVTTKFPVLDLGDSIGYFDMGTEVGKLVYNLTDYSVGAYYRIDSTYNQLSKNGNFLWNFSNSKDIINVPTGYLIGSLRNQAATTSYSNWNTEHTVAVADSALKSSWHHFEYTQSGKTGTVYVDGMPMNSDTTITSLPSVALAKSGLLGTLYNWIGRSCYTGDVYLRKTLVYDFRLYKTALTADQIQTSELNVANTIAALNTAYAESPSAVNQIKDSSYKVIASVGEILIQGLTGSEQVSVYDIAGSQLSMVSPSLIIVKAGVYIVKINGYVTKVVVK